MTITDGDFGARGCEDDLDPLSDPLERQAIFAALDSFR